MRRIISALLFLAFACCSASAQSAVRVQAQAVATCGSQSLTAGIFMPIFQDLTGTLCTASGGGSGGAVTNAGTFAVQAAQAGTWTVTGAGGTFPVTGTFWQATQPVSAVSWPLPTGAATQATLASLLTNLGAPFQAGGSIANTAFGISGTLPAFGATPTFNIGTAPTLTVTGPTPDGTAASTNPVLIAGTTDGTATGLVAVPKVTAGGVLSVDGSASTQPVSAASLPLPSGAATSAAQTTMATNQTGGGQKTQIVDGSNNVIGATANALDINIKSGSATVAASENHIGEVGGNILPITNAMTTSNATVTTGQSIGGIQALANAVRVSGSLGASGTSGVIQSVVLTFLDAVGSGPLDVYFYNATVTTGSNCQNATTFVLQTADRTNVLGVAHVTDFTSSNTAVVAQANNLAIPFGIASATSLFACVVARASFAITGTANASIKVNVLRN